MQLIPIETNMYFLLADEWQPYFQDSPNTNKDQLSSKTDSLKVPTSTSLKSSSKILKNNISYSIVTKNSSADSKSSTKDEKVPLSPGKFIDRSLPPTPPPEIDIPKSHSIWDSDTAKVSLLSASSNNNNKISLSSLSLKEDLKIQPWYKSWDRKKAEQMLLKCKY